MRNEKTKTQTPLRLSEELLKDLKEIAQAEDRSLNNYLVRELSKIVDLKKSK